MELIKTQITRLDEMLGGGLPEKSVILMLGEPGSGNNILAQQIMYKHALRDGKVAYFSSRSPGMLEEDFETFGWQVSALEADHWVFIEMCAPRSLQTLQKELSQRLREGYWTIIDSLSYLVLTQDLKSVLQVMTSFLNGVQKHGGIHFLLLTKGMHDLRTDVAMQDLSDGGVDFVTQRVAGGPTKTVQPVGLERHSGIFHQWQDLHWRQTLPGIQSQN